MVRLGHTVEVGRRRAGPPEVSSDGPHPADGRLDLGSVRQLDELRPLVDELTERPQLGGGKRGRVQEHQLAQQVRAFPDPPAWMAALALHDLVAGLRRMSERRQPPVVDLELHHVLGGDEAVEQQVAQDRFPFQIPAVKRALRRAWSTSCSTSMTPVAKVSWIVGGPTVASWCFNTCQYGEICSTTSPS